MRLSPALCVSLLAAAVPASGQSPGGRALTLEEALAVAGAESPDLAFARADLARAGAERLAAWGAFLPSIELSADYLTSSTGRLDPTGQTFSTSSYTAELTGTYQVFDGFGKLAGASRAGRRVDAARAGLREGAFRTALDVKTAFFTGLAEAERVAIETERIDRLEVGLEVVGIRLAGGRASRSDSLRAEV
ncbi:MAG TPA: TolC family protein, partial [Gemmatimonadota bacterium]|nr:TolC family protein [Gemmatimonadota bacterium]